MFVTASAPEASAASATVLAKDSVPDWVIRAQFGHVSPAMMAVYSHVRRKALDEAAKALEPDSRPTEPETPAPPRTHIRRQRVTSHVTSQLRPPRSNVIDFPKESGGPYETVFATFYSEAEQFDRAR